MNTTSESTETPTANGPEEWRPPGPGPWELDATHYARPVSRFYSSYYASHLAHGFSIGTRRYGLLIDHLDCREVNGFSYTQPVPAEPDQIPARFQAAESAVADELWLVDMERWDREARPASIEANRAVQAVDPSALDDPALLAHLGDCVANHGQMLERHHEFNFAVAIPFGELLATAGELTDLTPGQLLALVSGAAPESAGRAPELDDLIAAIDADDHARNLVDSDEAAESVLSQLCSSTGPVGAAAHAYIDMVGFRLLDSQDPGSPMTIEVPAVIVDSLRRRLEPAAEMGAGVDTDQVLAQVPDEHRQHIEHLVHAARATARLRDERALYCNIWAGGLVRRALLEVGSRLQQRGLVDDPTHALDATCDEIESLATSAQGPSASTLAARNAQRQSATTADAPPFIGDPPAPPPPLDELPPPVARLMRAAMTALAAVFAPSANASDDAVVRGIGASPGDYVGTARVVAGPEDIDRIEPGDVLVAPTTTSSFNIALPLIGALVTDGGGLLSHAAIIAREFGIPAVVGTLDATALITDGTSVRVDGNTGAVHLLTQP